MISLQPRYSLISREIEPDVLPTARRHGLGTLTYGPLAGGVLSGKHQRAETPAVDTRYGGSMGLAGAPGMAAMAVHALSDRNIDIAEAVGAVAADLETTPSAVAVAWLLGRRGRRSLSGRERRVSFATTCRPSNCACRRRRSRGSPRSRALAECRV